eukprot:m.203135 g.203135  ORF g.203135 m.203135 type:complete len:392 (+) comp14987_c2_seq2:179-1354(+)
MMAEESTQIKAEVLALEHPLLKVPLDSLVRTAKQHQALLEKKVEKAVAAVKTGLNASSQAEMDAQLLEAEATLSSLITQAERQEATYQALMQTIDGRYKCILDLLKGASASLDVRHWRYVADYLLHEGFYDAATSLVKLASLQDVVNTEPFRELKNIEASLRTKTTGLALAWCRSNKKRLDKLNSQLEFNLTLQEYIEHIRGGRFEEALNFAQSKFPQFSAKNMNEIQAAMALAAFGTDPPDMYKHFFDEARWDSLVDQFRRNNCALNSLTARSQLDVTLFPGVAALKSPECPSDPPTHDCLLCSSVLGEIAVHLPYAQFPHTVLRCAITHELVGVDNPPLMFPDGVICGKTSLEQVDSGSDMDSSPEDHVTHPVTKEAVPLSSLQRLYIL